VKKTGRQAYFSAENKSSEKKIQLKTLSFYVYENMHNSVGCFTDWT